jgi:hypothetical protein
MMLWLLFSVLFAALAAVGRQAVVIARFRPGLWLFPNWRWLQPVLTGISVLLAIPGGFLGPPGLRLVALALIALLNGFAFFFDMSFFFPEVRAVRRAPAEAAGISPDAGVLGLVLGGTPAAYPIEAVLMPRHIVHDTIAGHPVLVSYCALCRSALAFCAAVDGQRLYFKVVGVWRRNMIMLDIQTRSLWQQATGACIFGTYLGRNLALLPSENTTWKNWHNKHPDSEAAVEFAEARRGLLSREGMLAGLKAVTSRVMLPGMTDLRGLPPRETVFGVVVNGQSRAYPQSRLADGETFTDFVGGVEICLRVDERADSLSVVRADTGKPIPVEKHWWLGWKEFHPGTAIWQARSPDKPG